jgi:hypothetical protein
MATLTRRKLIGSGLQLLAVGPALRAGTAAAETCSNANASADAKSLRTSLHYVDSAADATKSCKGCAFYNATKDSSMCGYCMILDGPVSPSGHCDSWNMKEE